MDWDECSEIENLVNASAWVEELSKFRGHALASWVSKFHPDKLLCSVEGEDLLNDLRGSFNWICKVRFTNDEAWAVRFPRGGKVMLPDEKVEAEVATITIIREQTDIPVPEIKAWGLSADNELGLGPFIMSVFVEGVSLGDILRESGEGRIMRENLGDTIVETIYRQVAHFMLQLSKLDFDHIGNLSRKAPSDASEKIAIRRPLTLKAHNILHVGGVDVLHPVSTKFLSSIEYFNHLADQDLRHLYEQLNSVDNEDDARRKYAYWIVASKLVPRFAIPKYQYGPFKLLCDDFTPMNMIVDNSQDLRVIAVIDWEWSYAGPREFFWSPPRWLVGQTPNMWTSSDENLVARYNTYLEIYIQMVQEQEQAVLGNEIIQNPDRPSALLRRCQRDGSMWFYHILREAFNGPTCVPFEKLRRSLSDFDELVSAVPKIEIDSFVRLKLEHLQRYASLLAEKKQLHTSLLAYLGWSGNT